MLLISLSTHHQVKVYYWETEIDKKSSIVWTNCHIIIVCLVQMDFHLAVLTKEGWGIDRERSPIITDLYTSKTWVNKFSLVGCINSCVYILLNLLPKSSLRPHVGVRGKVYSDLRLVLVDQELVFKLPGIKVDDIVMELGWLV